MSARWNRTIARALQLATSRRSGAMRLPHSFRIHLRNPSLPWCIGSIHSRMYCASGFIWHLKENSYESDENSRISRRRRIACGRGAEPAGAGCFFDQSGYRGHGAGWLDDHDHRSAVSAASPLSSAAALASPLRPSPPSLASAPPPSSSSPLALIGGRESVSSTKAGSRCESALTTRF